MFTNHLQTQTSTLNKTLTVATSHDYPVRKHKT